MIAHQSKSLGILLVRGILRHFDYSICKYILVKPTLPFDIPVLQILLCSDHEESFHFMNTIQLFERIVATVKYIV